MVSLDATSIRAALRELFPEPSAVAVASVREMDDRIAEMPEEARMCEGYAPPRRREFLAGRACARACLMEMGMEEPPPISIGPHREPLWPGGFGGSVAHGGGWAAAVVVRKQDHASAGLDLESIGRLHRRVWRLVLTPSERARLGRMEDETAADLLATLTFSAKEAFYKWQFPLTRSWLGFQDVEVSSGSPADCLRLRIVAAVPPHLSDAEEYRIGCRILPGMVMTGILQ